MSQPIILNAALAVQNYGMQALIGAQVVFVREVLDNGDVTMKTGVIIDDFYYIIDEPCWENAVLFVEVIENGNNMLHAIFAHEQLALLKTPSPQRRVRDNVGGAV